MDGSNWLASPTGLPGTLGWNRVIYGGNLFVATSSGTTNVAFSLDGRNWAMSPGGLPTSALRAGLAYGNGQFIALDYMGSNAAYSYDGLYWSNSVLTSNDSWFTADYGNGVFVATSVSDGAVAYSGDGINWTNTGTTLPAPDSLVGQSMAYGNGVFAAILSHTQAVYSPNGINW